MSIITESVGFYYWQRPYSGYTSPMPSERMNNKTPFIVTI